MPMRKMIAAAAIATATSALSLAVASSAAQACSNGYKSVRIEGNYVCMIDASASNNLAAPGAGSGAKAKIQRLKRQ